MHLSAKLIVVIVLIVGRAVLADELSPTLTSELKKLAASSPSAKELLAKTPMPGGLKLLGELGYYAAETSGWSFERMQSEFPTLCSDARLVATVHAEDGQHYVIYTADGLGPFAGTVSGRNGFVWFGLGKSVQLKEVAAYYRYSVIEDIRGDVLIATFSPRIMRDATVRTVHTSHLYIHDRHIELLKHVTEEYPIRTEQAKGKQDGGGQPAARPESK